MATQRSLSITRVSVGEGCEYWRNGKRLRKRSDISRIEAITIPPAWTNVEISASAMAGTIVAATSIEQPTSGELLTTDAIDVVVKALEATVKVMRDKHDAVDEADPTTADILHQYNADLEQQAWFISAEKRTPRTSK